MYKFEITEFDILILFVCRFHSFKHSWNIPSITYYSDEKYIFVMPVFELDNIFHQTNCFLSFEQCNKWFSSREKCEFYEWNKQCFIFAFVFCFFVSRPFISIQITFPWWPLFFIQIDHVYFSTHKEQVMNIIWQFLSSSVQRKQDLRLKEHTR